MTQYPKCIILKKISSCNYYFTFKVIINNYSFINDKICYSLFKNNNVEEITKNLEIINIKNKYTNNKKDNLNTCLKII